MAQNFQLKDFDDVVMGFNYDYHFPVANVNEVILPMVVQRTNARAMFIFVFSLIWSYIFSQAIFLDILKTFNYQKYNSLIAMILMCIIDFIQARYLFFYNRLIITNDSIQLPVGYFGNTITLSFAKIYSIYFTRIKIKNGYLNTLHTHYLKDVSDYNSRAQMNFILDNDESYARKITAITRTAMLNYHQKHNITNLPKVQFIQQK